MTTATINDMRTDARVAVAFARDTARTLGRKFTDDDVWEYEELAIAALEYAYTYRGDFGFMREMHAAAERDGTLSTPMARGVLNCLRAEVLRELGGEVLPLDGIVTLLSRARAHLKYPKVRLLTSDGDEVVVSIAGNRSHAPGSVLVRGAKDEWGDRPFFGRIYPDGTFKGAPAESVMILLRAFAADPEGVASAYGRLTGNCCFCGLPLSDERSTSVGYGPVCAKSFGLNWGTR